MDILMSPRFLFGNVSQYLSELFHLKQFLRIVRTAPIEKPATGSGFSLLQRGQGNFELATNCDYIHLGQLTQAKVSVSVGFQSLP